jgi:hypothetical protein
MYRITEVIENDGAPCLITDVAFHPSGACFAVIYQDVNEVRIYESRTRKLLHVLRNPESELDEPHGIFYTENYLIVTNRHQLKKPSLINVYRNSGSTKKPIQIFQTPFDHLIEAHSLAVRDGRLVATYCENVGAIVCYGFNQKTGKITDPLDKVETWFSDYGEAKGICFNEDGTKLLVTFQSELVDRVPTSIHEKVLFSFERDNGLSLTKKLLNLSLRSIKSATRTLINRRIHNENINPDPNLSQLTKFNLQKNKPDKNGIAIFSVNAQGKIDCKPEEIIVREKFCRLENIDILDGVCAIPDTLHQAVLLYDMRWDPKLKHPFQTIDLGRTLPHGVRFSPDGRLLIITTFAKEVVNERIQWESWLSPREDNFFVCERAS